MNVHRGSARDGIIVGLIAYAAVAAFYGVSDLLAARGPLFTVNMLGQGLFNGLRDPAVLQTVVAPDLGVVAQYNALHLVVSLAVGQTVVGLVAAAERRPHIATAAFFVVVGGYVATVAVVAYLTAAMRPLMPVWTIAVANAGAAAVAGVYLLRRRPGTWKRLSPFRSVVAASRVP